MPNERKIRLTSAFIARIEGAKRRLPPALRRSWLTVSHLSTEVRDILKSHYEVERNSRRMMDGEPVSETLVSALFNVLQRKGPEWDDATLKNPMVCVAEPNDPIPKGGDAWMRGWISLEDPSVLEASDSSVACGGQLAYVSSEADFFEAAETILRTLAWKSKAGAIATPDEAIEVGCGLALVKDAGEFVAWLRRLVKFDPRTVRFAVHQEQRVGVTVVAPLSQASYRDFAAGEVLPHQIGIHHLHKGSEHLMLAAVAECDPGMPRRKRKPVTEAHVRAVLRQFAAFTPDVYRMHARPSIVSFGGSKMNLERLRALSFREVPGERSLPATDMPIMEVLPVVQGKSSRLQLRAYLALLAGIQECQLMAPDDLG